MATKEGALPELRAEDTKRPACRPPLRLDCNVDKSRCYAPVGGALMSRLSFARPLRTFLRSDDGPTAVEYALILSAILAICLLAVQAVGRATGSSFERSSQQLSTFIRGG